MEIHCFDALPSTNRAAVEAARAGAAAFYTVMAKSQTAGRGRLSRFFHSPVGGTYFSTVLRPTLPRAQYGSITPFAALAVRRAIAELTGVEADVKWINDLYVGGKKICGILAEAGEDLHGKPFVVLGIGINTGTELPRELRAIATTVPFADPHGLTVRILEHLQGAETAIREGNWIEEYRALCLWLGELVWVTQGQKTRRAKMLDVTENGALAVEWESGERAVLCGGEISLRPAQKGEI